MEIQGRIKTIFATETVGQNGFQKRDLVISTDGQYPQDIIIQFTQGNCALLDNLQIGQMVKIHFNLQGREWTSPQGEVKYFNTVLGWKIELIQTTNVAQSQYQQAPQGYQQPVAQATPVPPTQRAPQQVQQPQIFDNNGKEPNPAIYGEDGLPF